MTVLDEFTIKWVQASAERNCILEERIKLYIKPKPTWVPQVLYDYFLKELVVVEIQSK